jgi:hypothetical protein
MATSAFHLFPSLPPELRFLIWETAFCVPSVWAAVRVHRPTSGHYSSTRAFTMTFVGPAPPAAGMSCKEAWCLLKQSYGEQIRGPAGSTGTTRPYWVDLNHTVVYLGNPMNTMEILASFDTRALSKFKHVTLFWHNSRYSLLARACQRLATTCPALCTIIIQCCDRYERIPEGESAEPIQQPTTLERVAHYAEILTYMGRRLDWQTLDTPYLRSQLLQYLAPRRPSCIFLPRIPAEGCHR